MLAVAAQLDLVSRLSAVIAAVLPEPALGLHGALTGRVRTLQWSSHVYLPLGGLYDPCHRHTSRAVEMLRGEELGVGSRESSGDGVNELTP
jgi:hypothetical protein